MARSPSTLTVLVMSRTGSDALAPVVEQLRHALRDADAQIVVVDQSQIAPRPRASDPSRTTRAAVSRRTADPPRRTTSTGRAAQRGPRARVSRAAGRARPAFARVAGFALAGVTGLAVNSAALWAFVDLLHVPLLVAAMLATQVSTTWNFLLIDRFVYSGPRQRSAWSRFLGFAAVNNVVLLLRLPLLAWFVHTLGMGYLWANVVTLLIAFTVRYLISDRYLFRTRSPHDAHAREATAAGVADGRHRRTRTAARRAATGQRSSGGARDRPERPPVAVPA